jgi:hypothetical protein
MVNPIQNLAANKIRDITIHFHHDPGSLLCRFPGHGEDGSLGTRLRRGKTTKQINLNITATKYLQTAIATIIALVGAAKHKHQGGWRNN